MLIYHSPLGAEAQQDFGIDPVQPLAMADRVRYAELDPLNHVNNAVYMAWFEKLRIRYAQDWGLSDYGNHGPNSSNPRIVVAHGTIRYLQEMRMDEDYVVTCCCTEFRRASYALTQQLWSGGSLRATFDCLMVHLEPNGSGKRPLPETAKDRFLKIDQAQEG